MEKHSSPAEAPSDAPYANVTSYAHSGTIADPSLCGLRDQIKKVLIPTLIKIFQLKLELSQTVGLPSRLYTAKISNDPRPILEQLSSLDGDLHTLTKWCDSCRAHIAKAMHSSQESLKQKVSTKEPFPEDALVKKSFSSILSHKLPHKNPSPLRSTHHFTSPLRQKRWKLLLKTLKHKLGGWFFYP